MSNKNELEFNVQQKINSVEEFEFEPIKGYPMLHWKGKRPFTSTVYYPAQIKERHGVEYKDWMNKIYWGDNLQVMSHLLKEYRGQVDLVYIDPPFDSKADYKKKIKLKGHKYEGNISSFEEKQYTDMWNNDEFLQFIYERLILIRELLSPTGSVFIHCDPSKNYLIRCLMDEIFGPTNFVNEIVWSYRRWPSVSRSFQSMHDTIYYYSFSNQSNRTFNKQYEGVSESYMKRFGGKTQVLDKSGTRKITLEEDTKGMPLRDVWEISVLAGNKPERVGYPTQKPEELVGRIIDICTRPGDLVFDCFMGSGTTQAVALKAGRRFIGADINLGAIQTTTKRLISILNILNGEVEGPKSVQLALESEEEELDGLLAADEQAPYGIKPEIDHYKGFEVFNVNHYDIFRNPIEAKELLIKALEIQALPNNNLYDGEKDGRLVKIMPINRIATRADLNELITGFNYKEFEKRNADNPGKPVESITLVCMGHEPDLGAQLKNNVPYNIDVEVVDILRDKSNLEFKRDSEAVVKVTDGNLVIEQFYPMNLLQKLSLMKENVTDWRELVESVMIDFNYDGAVFEPSVVDVPEKAELVKGTYPVPVNAGTIRIKITDLLSESLEQTING